MVCKINSFRRVTGARKVTVAKRGEIDGSPKKHVLYLAVHLTLHQRLHRIIMVISRHGTFPPDTAPELLDDTKAKGKLRVLTHEESRALYGNEHEREGPPGQESSISKPTIRSIPNVKDKAMSDSVGSVAQKSSKQRIILTFLRFLFIDSSLLFVLGISCFLMWVEHVHKTYLVPQLDAAEWTKSRASKEMTYYNRPCSNLDLSTPDKQDLFLADTATPQDAYEHQLRHGFTVFPKVLTDETATNLRNYIVFKNSRLTKAESNFVIANEKRYSFNLGMEEPSVSKAAMEITNNSLLKASVEKIMGKNPALIEMTTITSAFGASAQYYHGDVIPKLSPVQNARAFGPSFSIFVALQNTTKSMGATSACPGTHMCSSGGLKQVCDKHGIQLVGKEGYYRAGDALLMNMNR